jgi:hypothetical protein
MSRRLRCGFKVDANDNARLEVLEMQRRRGAILIAAATLGLTLAMSSTAAAAPGATPGASLAAVRDATARFHDRAAALAAGYIPVSDCEELPGVGGMGVHYLNPTLAADLSVDPLRPELLLYAPTDNGWRLVGVEYFAAALAVTESGPARWFGDEVPPLGFFNSAPSVLGRTLDGPMAGHNPQMPWHYDLHVWIWQANPSGVFERWNPTVRC